MSSFDLDSVLNYDQTLIDQGASEGESDGRKKALRDGRRLGVCKGVEVGLELGFYKGACLLILSESGCCCEADPPSPSAAAAATTTTPPSGSRLASLPSDKQSKVLAICRSIVSLVDAFPLYNAALLEEGEGEGEEEEEADGKGDDGLREAEDDDDDERPAGDDKTDIGSNDKVPPNSEREKRPNAMNQMLLCRSKFKVLTLLLKKPEFTLQKIINPDKAGAGGGAGAGGAEW